MHTIVLGNLRSLYSNIIATFVSVLIGMGTYGVVMVSLKAFTRDEIMILPKSHHIIEWLEKHRLIKE